MELRSRRLIASGEARRHARLGFTPSEPDHISALPDELLLQVLARLGCVATAARTSVIARRWRGLWTRLLDLAFPDAPFRSLGKALDALGRKDAVVSSFDIRVADQPGSTRAVSSLLRAAAWFLPVDLAVAVPSGVAHLRHPVELPCFGFERTATISLVMDGNPVELRLPTSAALAAADVGECLFPALTTLDLCGYYTHDGLAALLPHCPLLRVLRYAVRYHRPCDQDYAITIHSPTLRELIIEESGEDYVHRIDIAAPALEQLTVSFDAREDLTVSVLAPMAEKVSWRCRYDGGWFTRFGCWEIEKVSLISPSPSPAPTAETRRPTLLRIDACKGSGDYWFIKADDYPADYLEQELEKHLQQQVAADLSAMDLELHLTPLGHVYGAFVFHLLGTRPVRTAARSFKLALLMPERREDVEGCETFTLTDVPPMEGCYCEPSWRSEAICSTELEEVEIDGFRGDDHEFGFLEMVFRCAPMLRRMTVKQSNEVAPSDEKIQDIFKAHPFVECQYVLSS